MARLQHVESADGTRIAFRISGSGEPLVLVHGAATSSADWAFAAPHLTGRFTVISMDRRGRGESGDGAGYAIEREADDVLAVLAATDARLLVGHSYGALCSALAAERTDRLRRVVLYEPPVAIVEARLDRLDALVAAGDFDRALEGFLRSVGTTDEQVEAIRSSRAWPVLLDAVPAVPRELHAAASWRPPAGPIDAEALFLLGADTTASVYLDGLDELRAAFPASRLERIPGQQHVAHVFAPAEFAAIVAGFCSG